MGYKHLDVREYLGKEINLWTVVGQGHYDDKNQQYWRVRCRCGDEGERRASHITRGLSRSCIRCRPNSAKGRASPHWEGSQLFSKSYLTRYRLSANNRGLAFELTLDDLDRLWEVQGGLCAYTSDALEPESASIDRIDNSVGYLPDNIQFVKKEINFMKHVLTEEDFLSLCIKVAQKCGGSCGV